MHRRASAGPPLLRSPRSSMAFHAPTRFVLRHAACSLVVGLALPLLLGLAVAPKLELATLYDGWTPRLSHGPVEDVFALLLALQESARLAKVLKAASEHGNHSDDGALVEAPRPQSVPWEPVRLIFYTSDGTSLMRADRLREMLRLEELATSLLADQCLHGPPPSPAPHEAAAVRSEVEVGACTTQRACSACAAEVATLFDASYACRLPPTPPSPVPPPSIPSDSPRAPPSPPPPPRPPSCDGALAADLVGAWRLGCRVDRTTLQPTWGWMHNSLCCRRYQRVAAARRGSASRRRSRATRRATRPSAWWAASAALTSTSPSLATAATAGPRRGVEC